MNLRTFRRIKAGRHLVVLAVLAIIVAGGLAGWATQNHSNSSYPARPAISIGTALATLQSGASPLNSAGGSSKLVSFSNSSLSITSDRLVIFVGRVVLNVSSAENSLQDVRFIAAKYGGYVSDSSISPIGNDGSQAQVTMRVPAEKFNDALDDTKKVGKLESLDTSSRDVTDNYLDLDARLASSKMLLAQYQRFLNQTRNVTEALAVQSNIDRIQTQIELLKTQIQRLENQVNFATIFVTLHEARTARQPVSVLDEAVNFALQAIQTEERGISFIIIGFSPIWVWVVPLTVFLVRRSRVKELKASPNQEKTAN